MTTDRELLELAAKAAGIRLHVWGTKGDENFADLDSSNHRWNPLADDGDALRLAVKLYLFNGADFYHFRSMERFASQELDDCTATRRAIVRAAAAIGATS